LRLLPMASELLNVIHPVFIKGTLTMRCTERQPIRRALAKAAFLIAVAGSGSFVMAADQPEANRVVPPREGTRETIQLFNGKDLSGWEGHSHIWSVEDGEIVGKNTKRLKVSTYLLTERQFTDFRLVFKVKLVESERHSGIAFWGRTAPHRGDKYTFAGHLVICPVEWGLYDLYGRRSLDVDRSLAEKVEKPHDWNDLEILAQGNRIRVVVNGTQTMDYVDTGDKALFDGPIGLQLHSNNVPQEIRYKDLVLTTFPEAVLTTLKP
jgi:hypothetical protein